MYGTLLGQVTPPSSGDFWNPANWSTFVEKLGVVGFFALILFAFFVWFLWRALGKWDKHLERSEKLQASQLTLCRYTHGPGGVANTAPLVDVGHDFAEAAEVIGRGVSPATGKAVAAIADRIHVKLRVAPPALPQENMVDPTAGTA